ncbi:MAG: hypothetical protein HKN04_03760 [Rhodothermaceae bacterium]|nr:hypothetical protein [Rhodothermaceae bacterium]
MRFSLFLPALLALLTCAPASSQNKAPSGYDDLNGDWVGTLTYTNYQDDASRVTLPLTATASVARDPSLDTDGLRIVVSFTEPDGSSGGTRTTFLTPLSDGSDVFGYDGERWPLVQHLATDGLVQYVIERDDLDNNRLARIRHTITYQDGVLTDQKEVRYEGTDAFFERNLFRFTRP